MAFMTYPVSALALRGDICQCWAIISEVGVVGWEVA